MLRPLFRMGIILAILAWFFPTISFTNGFTLMIASIVMAILFSIVKPLLKIVFLPVNIVTFGLFSIILNVALLWLVTFLVPGFVIEPTTILGVNLNSFMTLLLISTLITFLQGFLKLLI